MMKAMPRVSAQEVASFAAVHLGIEMRPEQIKIARAVINGDTLLHQPSRTSGRAVARDVALAYLAARGPAFTGEQGNLLRDNYVTGVDMAMGDDFTSYTIARIPGRFRRFLRRIGLDRSKWEYKIVSTGIVKNA